MKVLFATTNPAKVKKYKKALEEKGIELLTLKDLDINIKVEETGKNAIENAYIKAKAYYDATGIISIGLDNNLFIEELPEERQPGVFVRRVNGKRLNDEEMIKHYTSLVQKYGKCGKLICKWVYGIATINKGKEATYTWKDNHDEIVKSQLYSCLNTSCNVVYKVTGYQSDTRMTIFALKFSDN